MTPDFDAVARVIRKHVRDLDKPGVLSARPGYKFTGGWITRKPAIVVSVRNKGGQAPKDTLPAQIGGIAVDVRQATSRQIAAADGTPLRVRPEHDEPTFPGEAFPERTKAVHPAAPAQSAKVEVPYTAPAGVSLDAVEDVMSITCHASPDAGWAQLSQFLGGVQTSLTVGMYDFTSAHVLQAVQGALPSPRRLSLVLDHPPKDPSADQTDDQTHDALGRELGNRLAFAWALERGSPRTQAWIFPTAYHIKVAVRDQSSFWLSSGNWNNSNQPLIDVLKPVAGQIANADRDWHVIVEHAGLARTFEAYLLHDLQVAEQQSGATAANAMAFASRVSSFAAVEGAPAPPEPQAAVAGRFPFEPLVVRDERVRVQPLLTPDPGSYATHVLELINSAARSFYMQTQYVHPPQGGQSPLFGQLIQAVKKKMDAGVDVRIIMSQYESTAQWLEALQSAGWDMAALRIQNRVHNKGIVVDSKVVALGSQNWSAQGVLENRDASLILYHEGAAKYFESIFMNDWTTLAKQLDASDGLSKRSRSQGVKAKPHPPKAGSAKRAQGARRGAPAKRKKAAPRASRSSKKKGRRT